MKNLILIMLILISNFTYSQQPEPPTVLTLDGEIWGTDSVDCYVFYLDQEIEDWTFVDIYSFSHDYNFKFSKKGAIYSLIFVDVASEKTKTIHIVVDNIAKYRMDLDYDDNPYTEFLLANKIDTYNQYVLATIK
jgi:hypothetical protein